MIAAYVDGEMLVTETKMVTDHDLPDCKKQGVGTEITTAQKGCALECAFINKEDADKCG